MGSRIARQMKRGVKTMKSPIMKVRREAVSTVNFEGMNRLPPVNGLREVRGEIVPGMQNVWYEYVPAC